MSHRYLNAVLNQRYRLVESLGGGRFGLVFRGLGLDPERGRESYCIRIFEPQDASRTRMLASFQEVAELDIPHVLPWLELGRASTGAATGVTFLVASHGQTLAQRLSEGPLSTAETVSLATDLATALDALHGNGLVYLKLTPSNIVCQAGQWALADRETLSGPVEPWLDAWLEGADPYYVALETWRRQYVSTADLWSLGMILLESLRGRLPWPGSGLLYELCMGRGIVPGDLPAPLDLIIRGCLMAEPGRRWTASNVLSAARGLPLLLDTSWRPAYAASPSWPVWSAQSGCRRLRGHYSEVRTVACSPSDDTIASGSLDGGIHLWHDDHFTRLNKHAAALCRIQFSPSGSILASGCREGEVCLWDVADRRLRTALKLGAPVRDLVWSGPDEVLVLLDDGGLWAVGLEEGAARLLMSLEQATCILPGPVWGRLDGQVRSTAGLMRRQAGPVMALLPDMSAALDIPEVWCLARQPGWWAAGGYDRHVYLRPDGGEPRVLRGHTLGVTGLAFSHDGRILVSGSRDRTVLLWDVAPA